MHTGWSVMLQCARLVQPLPGCGSDLCPLDMSRSTQLKNIEQAGALRSTIGAGRSLLLTLLLYLLFLNSTIPSDRANRV